MQFPTVSIARASSSNLQVMASGIVLGNKGATFLGEFVVGTDGTDGSCRGRTCPLRSDDRVRNERSLLYADDGDGISAPKSMKFIPVQTSDGSVVKWEARGSTRVTLV